jgi:hypothetical protein
MSDAGPVTRTDRGVTVAVRVTPGARRQRIDGVVAEADGRQVIRVSVTAPPEAGKANVAVIALLAKTWKVPKSAIAVQSGASSRRKLLAIAGDPAALRRRIEDSVKDTPKDG